MPFPRTTTRTPAPASAARSESARCYVAETGASQPRLIINFPTKTHWRAKSKLRDIALGLADLRETLIRHDVESLALPALGCGNGGLSWAVVEPLIESALGDLPLRIHVYPPQRAPSVAPASRPREPLTRARAALLALLAAYVGDTRAATLVETQKLLYFLQFAGEPLKLRFDRGPFGPYADNIRHLLQQVDGDYLAGYGDGTSRGGLRLADDAAGAYSSRTRKRHASG